MCKKAPAVTILTLTEALKKIFNADNEIRILGRHGEKKHEALLSREEYLKAADLGGYFRVSADTRDLNYGMYYDEGEKELSQEPDYTSENTERLDVDGMVELLMKLDYIKEELKTWG